MKELKKCPFCGGVAKIFALYLIMTTYLFGAAILMLTAPIWGLPYLIYKVRKEQKNEYNKATNKQERT